MEQAHNNRRQTHTVPVFDFRYPYVTILFDTSYGCHQAGDTFRVGHGRAMTWMGRGWARLATPAEVSAQPDGRPSRYSSDDEVTDEFSAMWLG